MTAHARLATTPALLGCLLLLVNTASAATVTYTNRVTFESQLSTMITDTYDAYTMFINPKAVMDAVLGETEYSSTGHNPPNHNLIDQLGSPAARYCAGCNGSFLLEFHATSVGTAAGVSGVGLDFNNFDVSLPYHLFVTFGDTSTQNFPLPAGPGFFGITSDLRIRSMHVGLASGGTTQSGSTIIDNLTIGDNAPPAASCTLMGPTMPASGDATLQLDSMSSTLTVDADFEFSTDGGTTFSPCTAAPGSPIGNPAPGIPVGAATFLWDSLADMIGTSVAQVGVIARASVDDGVSPTPGTCDSAPFDVDNTIFCSGLCGDCNLNGMTPEILDALVTAQIAAGLIVATGVQMTCCDVDASGAITVLDALLDAQSSAGLPVMPTCP